MRKFFGAGISPTAEKSARTGVRRRPDDGKVMVLVEQGLDPYGQEVMRVSLEQQWAKMTGGSYLREEKTAVPIPASLKDTAKGEPPMEGGWFYPSRAMRSEVERYTNDTRYRPDIREFDQRESARVQKAAEQVYALDQRMAEARRKHPGADLLKQETKRRELCGKAHAVDPKERASGLHGRRVDADAGDLRTHMAFFNLREVSRGGLPRLMRPGERDLPKVLYGKGDVRERYVQRAAGMVADGRAGNLLDAIEAVRDRDAAREASMRLEHFSGWDAVLHEHAVRVKAYAEGLMGQGMTEANVRETALFLVAEDDDLRRQMETGGRARANEYREEGLNFSTWRAYYGYAPREVGQNLPAMEEEAYLERLGKDPSDFLQKPLQGTAEWEACCGRKKSAQAKPKRDPVAEILRQADAIAAAGRRADGKGLGE